MYISYRILQYPTRSPSLDLYHIDMTTLFTVWYTKDDFQFIWTALYILFTRQVEHRKNKLDPPQDTWLMLKVTDKLSRNSLVSTPKPSFNSRDSTKLPLSTRHTWCGPSVEVRVSHPHALDGKRTRESDPYSCRSSRKSFHFLPLISCLPYILAPRC